MKGICLETKNYFEISKAIEKVSLKCPGKDDLDSVKKTQRSLRSSAIFAINILMNIMKVRS